MQAPTESTRISPRCGGPSTPTPGPAGGSPAPGAGKTGFRVRRQSGRVSNRDGAPGQRKAGTVPRQLSHPQIPSRPLPRRASVSPSVKWEEKQHRPHRRVPDETG